MSRMDPIRELLAQAGPALSDADLRGFESTIREFGTLADELRGLMTQRNGFYAFADALHVFSLHGRGNELGLREWNSPRLWKSSYGDILPPCLCFAEDVFGGQFCIRGASVVMMDPETGELDHVADTISDWARAILRETDYFTGRPFAEHHQKTRGRLPARKRLVPVKPFVIGGAYDYSNLALCDAVQAMRFRGELAQQIANLPDGTEIEISFEDQKRQPGDE